MRSKGHPADLLEQDGFKVRWCAIKNKIDTELAKERALKEDGVDDAAAEPELDEAAKISKGLIPPVPGKYARDSKEHLAATAVQTVCMYVNLNVEPLARSTLVKQVAESNVGRTAVTGKTGRNCVLISADANLWAEAKKHPASPPKMTAEVAAKIVGGCLAGRGADDDPDEIAGKLVNMPAGDICVFNDAGVTENGQVFMGLFKKNGTVEFTNVACVFNEDSARKNKKRQGQVSQMQTLHFASSLGLDRVMPEKNRAAYAGTSRGSVIGWINAVQSEWTATVSDKQVLYGEKMVGNAPSADSSDFRPLDSVEPVFYNALSHVFWEDFLATYSVRAVVDATPGAGELAKAAINMRLPYFGICLTEIHMTQLKERLTVWLQHSMKTKGTPHYSSDWAGILKNETSIHYFFISRLQPG